MRSRNIKPGFFKCEDLAECDPLARLLFAGLWCLADCDGRLEDRPKRIKAELFPFEDCDIEGLLGQLVAKGFIDRYQVDERKVIQVLTFKKHQRPHHKEASLGLPPNPGTKNRNISGDAQNDSGQAPNVQERAGSLSASSALNPSSLNPSSLNSAPGEPAKKEKKPRKERTRDPLFDALAKVTGVDPDTAGSRIGKICKALRSANPPYEAADVFAFAEKVPLLLPWVKGTVTLSIIEEHIGKLRNSGHAAANKPVGLPPEVEELRRRDQHNQPNSQSEESGNE